METMASASWKSPRFDNPPVVETVLGVQFPALAFSSGHFGWFWREYLGKDWPTAADAPPLVDQFERFGDQLSWGIPGIQFAIEPITSARLQLTNAGDDRVVQVQNSRFIYNWRKRHGTYPSYHQIRPEFDTQYANFCQFVADLGLGAVAPNQWEVTYIHHVSRGTLWQSPNDWYKIIPGLFPCGRSNELLKFEGAGEWHYEIAPEQGRLHVALQRARAGSSQGQEVLAVQLTARGPIVNATPESVGTGLNIGHEAVVRAFLEMTSPEAHRMWLLKV